MDFKEYKEKIIKTKFATRSKGYDPNQVDNSIDDILNKLEELTTLLDSLSKQNKEQLDEIYNLKAEYQNLETTNKRYKIQVEELSKSGYHNEVMMQRIKKLEDEKKKEK